MQFSKMASSVLNCLNFTHDHPEANPEKRMPVLDTHIWMGTEAREPGVPKEWLKEEGEILKLGAMRKVVLHSFYKKPMANRVPNVRESAVPDGHKMATISQEIIRRLKNTSRDLPVQEMERVLKEYMDELILGGYNLEFRVKVLTSAMKGYMKMYNDQKEGTGRIN